MDSNTHLCFLDWDRASGSPQLASNSLCVWRWPEFLILLPLLLKVLGLQECAPMPKYHRLLICSKPLCSFLRLYLYLQFPLLRTTSQINSCSFFMSQFQVLEQIFFHQLITSHVHFSKSLGLSCECTWQTQPSIKAQGDAHILVCIGVVKSL